MGSGPDAHGPADEVYLVIAGGEGGVPSEVAVVVADHEIAPGGVIAGERGFVGRPSGKEDEEAGVVVFYQEFLYHSFSFFRRPSQPPLKGET